MRLEDRKPDLAELGSLLEQLPLGIVVVDARSGELLVANEAAGLLRQWSGLKRRLARIVQDGGAVVDEVIEVGHDGGTALLSLSGGPVRDVDGELTAFVLHVHDLTERERRERAQRDFVTHAAHELQTPLTAIMTAIEVLQSGAKEIPAERERFLGHIEAECDRLGRLVRALLVLARAQVAGEATPRTEIPLRPLLDEIALSLRPAKGIEVRVRCPDELSALGTPELLAQSIANLAANAAKHTSEGWIRLSATRRNGRVSIEVADTGRGLPAGEEGRVFERFFRGGDRDREGFGLGLAIVREAVAAMGGSVDLRSPRRGGTVATIKLPAP